MTSLNISSKDLGILVVGVLGGLTLSYFSTNNKKTNNNKIYQSKYNSKPTVPIEEEEAYEITDKNQLHRLSARGSYDKEVVSKILQAGHFCHVAFNRTDNDTDSDKYVVSIPMLYGFKGPYIYVHGHSANGMIRQSNQSSSVCLSVAVLDGLVYARSLFHHSVNYRSVLIFGKAEMVLDDTEKNEALEIISNHIMPGRWREARLPSKSELKSTSVLRITIQHASAKFREGPPKDDKSDIESLKVWSGVLPIFSVKGNPINDPTINFPLSTSPSVLENDHFMNVNEVTNE